jgi:multiple sugar transport system substrate-binding protein
VATALLLCATAACGDDADPVGQGPTVTWLVGPDRLDAEALATSCSDDAAGDYTVKVEQLPVDVTERHALLVRRLLAEDDSMDVLSLDTAFTPELARFLAPVPDAQASAASEGVVPAAMAAATHGDRLVTVPWFLDPQVLWYRGTVAERAGLDTTKPISWDELVAGAQRIGVSIEIEDPDGSGLSQWVNALVTGAGGKLLTGEGRSAAVGLDSDAGRAAASVVEFYREAGVGPGPSPDAISRFAAAGGGFLLASTSAVADPALAAVQSDMRATAYPVVGEAIVPPLDGVALAVPEHSEHRDAAFAAITCLTSPPALQQLMIGSQHTASRLTTLDDPSVAAAFRSGDVARAAMATGATVPATRFWAQAVDAIDETWRDDVTQGTTPVVSQAEIRAAIRGELR